MKNKYETPLSEFLEGNGNKYVLFISKKQYAIEIDTSYAHEYMTKDIAKKTRPNMQMDDFGNPIDPNNSHFNDTIVALGYRKPFYMQIQFPERDRITQEQFDCLKWVLEDAKKYHLEHPEEEFKVFAFGNPNFELEPKDYQDNLDELLESVSKYITASTNMADEVIIGKAHKQELSIEEAANAIVDNMANNPILGPDSSYKLKIKGYSSILLLSLLTALISACILLFGVFTLIN